MTSSSKLFWIFIILNILTLFGLTGLSEGTFLSGWILPNPVQVVIIGLFFLNVIGVQVAAATGILMPPHNPFFGKRSVQPFSRTRWSKSNKKTNNNGKIITMDEFKSVERVLLSLRRIDSNDCFLKLVCQMNQDLVTGKETSDSRTAKLLKVFRLRELLGITKSKPEGISIWEVYENATKSEKMNCSKKYEDCPLSQKELRQYEVRAF